MIRWLLAFALTFVTLAAPARAACLNWASPPQMQSCCCAVEDNASCSMSDAPCCSSDVPVKAPAPQLLIAFEPTSAAPATQLRLAAVLPVPKAGISKSSPRYPPHLASNKLYIKKRSFLI